MEGSKGGEGVLEKAINCWIESCFDSFSTNEFVSSKLVGEAKR